MVEVLNKSEHLAPYRPSPILVPCVIVGLLVFSILDLIYIPAGIIGMYGAGVFNGGVRDQDLVDLSILIRALSALGQLGMFFILTTLFSVLIYRCAKNARTLGFTGFTHSPGMTVGWFYIPFAHLIMPYIAIAEIWQSSKATVEPGIFPEWLDMKIGPLLGAWWATWIFGTLINNTASRMSRSQYLEAIGMSIIPFAAALQVASAFLCIVVVYRLTQRQHQQALALSPQNGEHECPT
tara:strand:- start:2306 stop:3016 length:711 start_codon:yes stop_codon:yes gene_type:complete